MTRANTSIVKRALRVATTPTTAMSLLHSTAYNHRSLGRPLVLSRSAGDVELSALQSHVEQVHKQNTERMPAELSLNAMI
jgi:hypothetical protein